MVNFKKLMAKATKNKPVETFTPATQSELKQAQIEKCWSELLETSVGVEVQSDHFTDGWQWDYFLGTGSRWAKYFAYEDWDLWDVERRYIGDYLS